MVPRGNEGKGKVDGARRGRTGRKRGVVERGDEECISREGREENLRREKERKVECQDRGKERGHKMRGK